MHIGIDFDNTIVCYDEVFYQTALQQKLIPIKFPKSKGAIRDYLRAAGKENLWTELQGTVYGLHMDQANLFPGVLEFFKVCSQKKIPTTIISHKTLFPYIGPKYNLHEAAQKWLSFQKFSQIPVFFELTLAEKLSRISHSECTHFIDDLPELLSEKSFPTHVNKVLFDPNDQYSDGPYFRTTSWMQIPQYLCNER
jgi:hypothetical protein